MKKAYTIQQAVDLITEMEDEEIEEADVIDIVELPPETVDHVSDTEEIDDEDLTMEPNLRDAAGKLEVHFHGDTYRSVDDSNVAGVGKPRRKSVAEWMMNETPPVSELQIFDNSDMISNLCSVLLDKDPYDIFVMLTKNVFEIICKETIRYARQKNDNNFECSEEDLKLFSAVLILSGHRTYPRQTLYWSTDPNFECSFVRNSITKNRFKEIKKYLHFNNNDAIPENCQDRCYKIRPLLDIFNENFQQFGYFGSRYSVDEKIVEYFGKHPMKQYIRGKPIRFGFKE